MIAPDVTVTRWWLVRHAPVINPQRRIYGQMDVEADTSDTTTFHTLANALPRDAAWVATHLRRSRQTASAIHAAWETPAADDRSPPPRIEPALAEQSFGDWQDLTYEELSATQPEAAQRFWLAPASQRPPGGESFTDVVARVSTALERLTAAYAGQNIVAVLHGGSIRAALVLALGLEPEAGLRLRVDTLSLTRLDHITLPDRSPAWCVAGVNLPPGAVLPPG